MFQTPLTTVRGMAAALGLVLCAASSAAAPLAYAPQGDLFDTDYFHSEAFKQRFAESFINLSDVEPPVTEDEAEELQEILDLIQRSDDDGGDEAPDPNDPEAVAEQLAREAKRLEKQRKRNEKAMQKLQDALTKTSSPNYNYLIGQLHQAAGQQHQEDAEREGTSEIDAAASKAKAWERFGQAIAAYESAVDSDFGYPRFRRAWQQIGLLYFQRASSADDGDPVADYRSAARAYSKAVSLGLYDDVSFGIMGVALLNGNHVLPAENAFRQAMMMNPADNQWMMGLLQCLFRGRRYADATTLLDGMLTERPEDAKLWMLQGNAFIGLEKPERAARSFQVAENLGGGTAASLNILADIYINSGLTEVAVQKYLKALTLESSATPDRALRAARLLTGRGEVADAKTLLTGVESHFGGDLPEEALAEVLKMRAKIAAREGRGEEEVAVLRRIVDQSPLDGDAVILLAGALARGGEVEQALQYYEIAGSIEGFEARAKLRHGQMLVGQKRFAEAVPLLKASLDIEDKETVRRYMESVEKIARSSAK